jgi:hypothetical protein
MSRLRKHEDGSEEGAASTVMGIIQNNIRLRLKVERRMAAPFIAGNETLPGQMGNKRNLYKFRKIQEVTDGEIVMSYFGKCVYRVRIV